MKTLLVAFLLGFVILGVYLYVYLGAYKEVQVRVVNEPAFHIVYKSHVGPYHEIEEVIGSVEQWAREQNLPCAQTFGEYLDDPQQVPHERLRSLGGCLTPETSITLPEGFSQRRVEPGAYVEARFSGSPAISPFIVYPEIKRFIALKRLKTQVKSFEIYESYGSHKLKTRYLIPIIPSTNGEK